MLRAPNSCRSCLLGIGFLFLLSSLGFGQITNVTDDTSTPIAGAGHDYIGSLIDTVNPANGSLSVRIPVPVPTSVGFTLPFYFAYDSNGYSHLTSQNGVPLWSGNSYSEGGWTYTTPWVSYAVVTLTKGIPGATYQCNYVSDFVFQDNSGGRHALGVSYVWDSYGQCVYFPGLLTQTTGGDDSYRATLSSSGTLLVSDADGTTFSFGFSPGQIGNSAQVLYPAYAEDRNGNKATFSISGSYTYPAVTMTDTAGRQAVATSGIGSSSGDTITVSGLSPYTVNWETVPTSAPAPSQNQLVNDPYCDSIPGWNANASAIASIILPDGTSHYQFGYDPTFGTLNKITYPTGAWISYTWGWSPLFDSAVFLDSKGSNGCAFQYAVPVVTSRTVSFDGQNVALQQSFNYALPTWESTSWSWRQTTVSTTDEIAGVSSTAVYTYVPIYGGGQPNDQSSYNAQIPGEQQVVYENSGGSTLRTVTKAWYDPYEMACQLENHDGSSLRGVYYLYGWAQVTDKKEFDYGQIGSTSACSQTQQTAPSGVTPLRDTQTIYATGQVNPLGVSVLDRPSSIVVPNFDGAGDNAETDYGYDGKGNATSKTAKCAPGCGSLSWYYGYDGAGQQSSMTDPKSHETQYFYLNDTYLNKIQYADSSTVSFGYNFATGQLTSSTDQNGQSTQYDYEPAPSLDRLKSVSYPDGGSTTYTYGNACTQPTNIAIAPGYSETLTVDGMCHVTVRSVGDPQGPDLTKTTYDGLGRVWKVSNPYHTTGDTSYGLTTNSYDALGRIYSVVYPDGSATTTSYSGNTTTITDPAPSSRTLTYDGLEQLQQVTESGLSATTYYSHDALGDLVAVNQSGQARSFVYDSLQRLVRATNPESGVTNYAYPTSSNLCSGDVSAVCTRTDARGITTTYAYNDPLNRLTSKSYSDGTPTANFSYGETSVSIDGWTSPTLQYPVGRLTHTATTSGGVVLTATVEDYDKMGRPADYWQCTPVNCSLGLPWAASYNYDVAGNLTSWNHPAGFTISQPVDSAFHVTQVTSSANSSTYPGTLATGPGGGSIQYTAWGAVSQLQNGCAGSNCAQPPGDVCLNNPRMQMAVAELGTSSNRAQVSCREYSYVAHVAPSGCSESSSSGPRRHDQQRQRGGDILQRQRGYGPKPHGQLRLRRRQPVARRPAASGSIAYNQTYSYTGVGYEWFVRQPELHAGRSGLRKLHLQRRQ